VIRRDFIKLMITSLASYPMAATAQRSIPVVGALSPAARPAQFDSTAYAGFYQGMRELGYTEGKDYLIEWRFAEGDYTRLPALANDLVALNVKILFATSTASILAAHAATTTIPIVMGYFEEDPTERGLAASLAHPTGNVTGLAVMQLESVSKDLDLIRNLLPNLDRLGVLLNPTAASYRAALANVRTLAQDLRVTVLDWEARTVQEMDTAFNAIGQTNNVSAILVMGDAFFFANRRRLAELSLTNRLPMMVAGPREFAVAGALMSYGANLSDSFRRSAIYVDKILKGAKPGDLPIEEPTKFDLVINRKTAKALGFQIPDKMLSVADEVIE
jgi:putative tryptophan/tyrosine transport system substrate-binding protein